MLKIGAKVNCVLPADETVLEDHR